MEIQVMLLFSILIATTPTTFGLPAVIPEPLGVEGDKESNATSSTVEPSTTTNEPSTTTVEPSTTTTEPSTTTVEPSTTTVEPSTTTTEPLTTTVEPSTIDVTDPFEIVSTSLPPVCNTTTCSRIDVAILAGDIQLDQLEATSGNLFVDREVKWLVLEKSTHVELEVESVFDPRSGKTKSKTSENRFEQMKVLHDDRYAASENTLNIVRALQM